MLRVLTSLTACLLAACTHTITSDRLFKPPAPLDWQGMRSGLAIAGARSGELSVDNADWSHEIIEAGDERIAVSTLSSGDSSAPLLLYCHGAQANREGYASLYGAYLRGVGDPVVWDFPGYGDSSGAAGPESLARVTPDIAAWIDGQAGDRELILWGYSLGGWVCADIAARSVAVDALVLESTAASADAVAQSYSRKVPLLRFRASENMAGFDIPTMLAGLDVPVLVLSGAKDKVLPPRLQRELAESLDVELFTNPDTTHFDTYRNPATLARVKAWLAGLED